MRRFLLLFFGVSSLGWGASSPGVSARWSFLSRDVVQGHPITLSLEVTGTDKVQVPPLALPGVEVSVVQSAASRTVAADGSPALGFNVIWSLRSYRSGQLSLPGMTLETGAGPVLLPSLSWKVTPGLQDGLFRLVSRLDKPKDLYPGLTGIYSVEVWKRRGLKNLSLKLPVLGLSGLGIQGVLAGGLMPPVPGEVTLRDQGVVMKGVPEIRILNGVEWQVLTFQLNIRPTTSGRWDIPEGFAVFEEELPVPVEGKKFRPRILSLSPWVLEVKSLPLAGRPQEFSGLLGNLKLTAVSDVTTLPLGDAAPVYLKVEGLLGEETLDLDAMLSKALEDPGFRLSRGEAQRDGRRLYHLRFQKPGPVTFPPLELNYFNPDTGRYDRTLSKQLVFQVTEPGQVATLVPGSAEEASLRPDPNQGIKKPGLKVPEAVILLTLGGSFALAGALWYRSELRRRYREKRAWTRLWKNLPSAEEKPGLRQGLARLGALIRHPFAQNLPLAEVQREWEQALWSGKPCPWNPGERWKILREKYK